MEELQQKIFAALERKDTQEANNYMLHLCNMLIDESTESTIDSYLNLFFSQGVGVQDYLSALFAFQNHLPMNKLKSISQCFEVIFILLNNFPKQMEDYIQSCLNLCHWMIMHPKCPNCNLKCAEIFHILITSNNIELPEPRVLFIYSKIKQCLKNSKSTYNQRIFIQIIASCVKKKFMESKTNEIATCLINYMKDAPKQSTGIQNLLDGGYMALDEFMKYAEFQADHFLLIYQYLMRDVIYPKELFKKQGTRSCVKFISKHASKFSLQMQSDVQFWSEELKNWCNASSKDDSKAGYEALDALYKNVCLAWCQADVADDYFQKLLTECKSILENSKNDDETKLAICTIGYMAPVAEKFMPSKDFLDLFIYLLQKVEYFIVMNDEATNNNKYLSGSSCDYVEGITPFFKALKADISRHINIFKRVTIIMIKMFPKIATHKHGTVINTLRTILLSVLGLNRMTFQQFLEEIVKQGVLWTCSHTLAQEIEISGLDKTTYKDYLPLWRGLLAMSEPNPKQKEFNMELYNQLMENLIYMSNKLNLHIIIKDTDQDSGSMYHTEKCNDFVIFANLTDLYCDLLDDSPAHNFKRWIDTVSSHMIRKSTQLPLVSGFYKLLATCMKRCGDVDYFHLDRLENKEHVRIAFENLKAFLEPVLRKITQYKNELQLSCVLLVLHTPVNIIKAINFDFSGVFTMAFKIGQQNFPLACVALNTLNRWYKVLNEEVSFPLLKKVVPCLDAYLRNQFVIGDSYHVEGRKVKKYRQRKINLESEPELIKLQHKVLQFLATMPNDIIMELISASGELKLNHGETNMLQVKLAFGERHLGLWMDPFLDRVLLLSIECTDRKIRITACELLHAIVAVFLGTAVVNNSSDMEPILRKLLKALVRLACDQDSTVVTLFNPLLLQLAHWFSHPKQIGSTHSHAFIKILMEAVTSPNDTAIRDQAGCVLREFVAWTRRQNSKTSLKNNLHNIQLIIEHMKQFCLHPDDAKRYGATVIFNYIYRELREEDVIIDCFWLEITYSFVMNLSLVQVNDSNDDLLMQINLCLDRVTRCLVQKQDLLERTNRQRSTPPQFNGNTFSDAALFLLTHAWHINIHCRTKCIEMFKKLPSDVIVNVLKHFDLKCYMHDLQITPYFKDLKTFEEVLKHYMSLTCFIDGHIFITQLSPSVDLAESILWEILNKVIEEFKHKNLEYIQKMLNIQDDVMVRRTKDEFNYVKCKLIEKVFELYEVFLTNDITDFINENSWTLLADYLFDYSALGLGHLSKDKWEVNATRLLKLFLHATKFNSSSRDIFGLICRLGISTQTEWESCMTLHTEVSLSHRQFLRGLLVLKRTDTDDLIQLPSLEVVAMSTVNTIFKLLGLDTAEKSSVMPKIKDTQCEYFFLKLEMALDQVVNATAFSKEFDDLIMCLCDTRQINVAEINAPVERGYYFFLTFKKTILKYTATEDRIFNILQKMANSLHPEISIRYFKDYMHYLHKHPTSTHSCIKEEIIRSAEMMWPNIISARNYFISTELIQELQMLVGNISNKVILNSIIGFLHKKQPTDLQQIQHLVQIVRTLGMVSPRGFDEEIEQELNKMKKKNLKLLKLETKRIPTTLLIRTMFEATSSTYSLNYFIAGLDFYITIDNDFEVDAIYCKNFITQLPVDMQEDLLNGVFYLDNNYNFQQKIVLTLCLCNLLAYCSHNIFEAFYICQISKILEVFSLDSYESKTISCILLNRLFGNITVENFETRSCQITQAACANVKTGRELVETVAKILLNVCKDSPLEVDPEVFRLYQCYAYNALATLICNTFKGQVQFYQKLFVRIQDEADILWCKLVPLNKKYNFEIVAEDIPKMKKVLVDIRTDFSADVKQDEYLESQNLFLSTLAEDITNYDFTGVSVRYKENVEVMNNQKSLVIEMYQEDINKHECMTQICAVIKHMNENEMLLSEAPPPWLTHLSDMLLNPMVPINIRQFLCKIIENSQNYLKQYAKIFISGVIRTIIDTCDSLNSFASDLIVMLLTTWKSQLIDCCEEMNKLIPFMMYKLWNDRMDVFKYNVNLFRTMIETLDSVKVSHEIIESLFSLDADDKANQSPIHIINILLVNNISAFPINIKTLVSRMTKGLSSTHRNLYMATAETLGLSLKFLDETNHPDLTQFANRLTNDLQSLRKRNETKFIDVLEGIVKNYPLLGSRFLNTLFLSLIFRDSKSQMAYMKIYLKCITQVCEAGMLDKLNLVDWIKSSNLNTQIISLEITLRAVDYLEFDQIGKIIKVLTDLPGSNPICRSICTDIMISVYRRYYYSEDPNIMGLIKIVRRYLINGFVDIEPEIRDKINRFWTESDILPYNLETKMIHLLENMHDSSNEDIYLAVSNILLLHGVIDNGEPLFKALHKCEYRNYEVTAHWRARNASMMPMFTQSMHSQQYLQATQSYNQFEETQMLATQRQSYTETASVFGTRPIFNLRKTEFKDPNDMELSTDYKIKKWRFFKNKADVSKMHSIRESIKGKEIDKMREDVRKKKEVQVKIYRSYRTGDFPDIEINLTSIIEPLKELTKKDGQIARILYKSLFDSIVDIAVDEQFMIKANNAITNILTATTTYNPAMVGAFLHIALEYKNNMSIHPNLIKTAADNSGALSYGCLLLEEYIMKSGDTETSAKRGVAAETSEDTLHWVKLAELYKIMEEWDVVHGIFSDKMTCPKDVIYAIHAESENYWSEAREFYIVLINQDYDLNRKDFYYEAFFKCSEELSDWKDIQKRCEETIDTKAETIFNDLWSNEWYKKTLLPYFIKAQVRIGDKQQFENNLKEVMKDGIRKEYLRNHFADELSYLYLDMMKIKSALNYSTLHAKNFLDDWKFVKPFYTSLQNKMLLKMKNCVEINALLGGYDTLNSANFKDVITGFCNLWLKSNKNDAAASTPHLTTRNNVRELFIKILKLKLHTLKIDIAEQDEITNKLTEISFNSEVRLIQQALKQKNLSLAKKYTMKNMKTLNSSGQMFNSISYLLFSQVALLRAKISSDAAMYLESLKGYHKCVSNPNCQDNASLCIPALMHLDDLCYSLVDAAEKENFDLQPIQACFNMYPIRRFSDLLNYSFENMRDTLYRLDAGQNGNCLADAFLKLAKKYAQKGVGYENKYIECSLKSIEYGSEHARLLFPNLLDVLGLVEVHKAQFIQQTSRIPIWMFIRWIPQLLAHVDTIKVSVIKHLVIKLATEYPNSIIYAYKLSKDKYTYANNETYEVTNKLDDLLQNDLIDKMLKALRYVCVPGIAIRTALSKLKKACEDTEYVFKTVGEEVTAHLFDEEMDTYENAMSGSIHKSVIKNKPKLLSIINCSPFDKTTILRKIDELSHNIIDDNKESTDLGHYSPWLNYFHASNYEQEIEVPGRYTGNCKPLPHYHPKISKFSSDVTVFRSLRKPIQITIFANDVKEYRFLVKYGEDLRLDQRIQQLFKLMNVILASDSKCNERKLRVSTFEVIPLTGDLGFIQWVEETESLKSLIVKSSGYKTIGQKTKQAYEKYSTWVAKAGGRAGNSHFHNYAQATLKYTKDQRITTYNQIVSIFPWDALRKSLCNITADPEMFFALRHKFIKSYAVMCICNWLLGIGDRHLENMLMSIDSGEVVGIDFGLAFGAGTQEQAIPELVPFRLTPQIINLMLPLKESGLLHQSMVHTLRALRENYEVLLSTMNIFILEPTLNWSGAADEGWNPSMVLNLAKSKFTGRNPTSIMIDEIKMRTKDSPEVNLAYVQCLKDVIIANQFEGDANALNINEQVKCLIAHATDLNLLARMWEGWAPWM